MVINNIFHSIGDSLVIDNKSIIIGVSEITGFTDVTVGSDTNRYFDKYFQYTIDGLNWSEWLILINENLQLISPKENHLFRIKYNYIRSGVDETGTLEFKSIDLNYTTSLQLIPERFQNLSFSQFFEFFNLQSLLWSNNVLQKVYKKGIIPKYIDRDNNENWSDEDYIDLFWSILYSISIIVNYGREFENILYDKKFLNDYLRSRGLFLTKLRDLSHLDYLCQNIYSEYRKRGTLSITNISNDQLKPDGELIRLINKLFDDEFIFCLPDIERSSFTINKSSPCYRGINSMTNAIKGYEYTDSVEDLNNYPLINPQYITKFFDTSCEKNTIRIYHIPPGIKSGIGSITNISKPIKINPYLDYEVSFLIKQDSPRDTLEFGVIGTDSYNNLVNFVKVSDQAIESNFFFKNGYLRLSNHYYLVRGIIYSANQTPLTTEEAKLNIGIGSNLCFRPNMRQIEPYIVINNNIPILTSSTYIRDLKVRPISTPFSRCFLNNRNNIIMYSSNRGENTNEKVEQLTRDYLLPYNCSVLNVWL